MMVSNKNGSQLVRITMSKVTLHLTNKDFLDEGALTKAMRVWVCVSENVDVDRCW